MIFASALTPVLEVAGVWGTSIALCSGLAAAAALLARRSGQVIAEDAAKGAGAGFIVGVPLSIAAVILELGTS